jgi:hypothetical protein
MENYPEGPMRVAVREDDGPVRWFMVSVEMVRSVSVDEVA